jgi:hypothetical protein
MTISAEQRALRVLYCNLLEEIKPRLETAARAIDGEYKLPLQFVFEFAYLQIRLVCELIAIGCLAVHGDIPATRTGRMKSAYSADWIFRALEKLHPDFYPQPGFDLKHPDEALEWAPTADPYMTKPELLKLYNDSGEVLHRGTIKKFESKAAYPELDFEKLKDCLYKLGVLLRSHRIKLLGSKQEFWVTMFAPETGKVQATLVGPS